MKKKQVEDLDEPISGVIKLVEQKWLSLSVIGNNVLASNSSLTQIPKPNSQVDVFYNTGLMTVGNGDAVNCACYFSNDGGVTAKGFGDLDIGDQLYWNTGYAGFGLDGNELLKIKYLIIE